MFRRLFILSVLFFCCTVNLYSSDFVPKSREEVKKVVDVIVSTEQMKNMSDKIDTLALVTREINFKKSCTCIKRAFFGVLNEICSSALSADREDIEKLNLFLKKFEKNDSASGLYKRIIKAFEWILHGHHGKTPKYIKQLIISDYQKKFEKDVVVVLGYCPDDIISYMSKYVRNIYIINPNAKFVRSSKIKMKTVRNAQFILGTYEEKIPEVIKKSGSKIMFWVSNQNLKETLSGLDYLLKVKGKPVILIDNADLFTQDALKEISGIVKHNNAKFDVKVNDNIIRIN